MPEKNSSRSEPCELCNLLLIGTQSVAHPDLVAEGHLTPAKEVIYVCGNCRTRLFSSRAFFGFRRRWFKWYG